MIQGVFQGLDPGGQREQALHFLVHAYRTERAREIAAWAEEDYQRIMRDSGLYSFKPSGLYELVVYAGREEFSVKTEQPEWSGGVTVGNAIYAYEGRHLRGTLAHEMSHLIFNEFMGDAGHAHRWLNEGLAVYEEVQSAPPELRDAWERRMDQARGNPLPFRQMRELVPASERERLVGQWYPQVGSVVGFLIQKGGSLGLAQLLAALRDRVPLEAAFSASFPGLWADLTALENAWRK